MTQVVLLAFATNLPFGMILGVMLIVSALVEELVKSVGIVVLVERGKVTSLRDILGLAFLSGLGFMIGEKLLLLLSINIVSQASVSIAIFGAGLYPLIPLFAHFLFTAIVTLLRTKLRLPYTLALGAGTLVHFIYNWYLLRAIL